MSPSIAKTLAVNGQEFETQAETVADLLLEQGYGPAKVATALNGEFLPQRARAATLLQGGDRVEIVSIRQGG